MYPDRTNEIKDKQIKIMTLGFLIIIVSSLIIGATGHWEIAFFIFAFGMICIPALSVVTLQNQEKPRCPNGHGYYPRYVTCCPECGAKLQIGRLIIHGDPDF
jgi:hypothetical protein